MSNVFLIITGLSGKEGVSIDFAKILNLVEMCLDGEVDWNVIVKVLHDLPFVLQYEMNLIKDSEFLVNVFKYVSGLGFFKK